MFSLVGRKAVFYPSSGLLGSKSLEQLENREHKLV